MRYLASCGRYACPLVTNSLLVISVVLFVAGTHELLAGNAKGLLKNDPCRG